MVNEWKDEVCQNLNEVFENDIETLLRVHYFLAEEDNEYKDSGDIGPTWRILKSTLKMKDAFTKYAKRIAEDTKTAEQDQKFRRMIKDLYSGMMKPDDKAVANYVNDRFQITKIQDKGLTGTSAMMGLAQAISKIPVEQQLQMMEIIPTLINTEVLPVNNVIRQVNRVGGGKVMAALAAVYLTYEAIVNLRRWYKGEISGKRCCKNIIDCTFSVAAGAGGGVAGAAIGSFFGPIGTLTGGIIGSVITSQAASMLIDRLTLHIFGIPKDEALENAYRYFGVKMNASNNEINAAFRRKCLQHHPDKGGSKEEFIVVQANMSIIKLSRGEL